MRVLNKAEHRADILAQKAHVLSLLGKSDEAMKTFSQAIQVLLIIYSIIFYLLSGSFYLGGLGKRSNTLIGPR